MLPTVSEVLAMPTLRRAAPRVVAGEAGLSRPVRWVHAAELADIAHLLRGGELVLTTGIALPYDDDGLAAYIDGLAAVDVAGLVVELGRTWRAELPEALRAACDRARLPLIALGRETRFVAVTQEVGEHVVNAQLTELRAVERIHEVFTRLTVTGAEQAEILAEVARLTGWPVVLESIKHHVLGYDAAGHDPSDILTHWEQRSRAVVADGRTTYHEAEGWLVAVVGARGDDWGRLVLLAPERPGRRETVLLERAASALALHRLVAREREGLERHTHRTLLAALTATTPPSRDVLDRCADVGVPVRRRRLVGVVVAHRAPASTDELTRDLTEVVAAAARDGQVSALIAAHGDTAVGCLVSLPPRASDRGVVDRFAAAIHRAVAAMPRTVPVIVAAGTTVGEPASARRSLAEAEQVAAAAPVAAGEPACHRLHDVHIRGLLHLLGQDDRLTAFSDRELAAVRRYDADHGTSLLSVLRGFLTAGANKAAAASALHLSRPALYERLARLEHILGVDLSDPEVVTSLHVALLVADATDGVSDAG